MASVIIPAHNEAAVIQRCLGSLLADAQPNEVSVWVVANACSDKTSELARSFGRGVHVIESPVASKSDALNRGDAAATGFPRFYLDADVVFETPAIRKICEVLKRPGILAAAPMTRVNCTGRSWAVRAYYEVWLRLPYCRSGMIGSGVYALSGEGRRRFAQFPNITADDAFVRLHFRPEERVTVSDCTFTITPPKTLSGIIDIKTRSHFGNEELKRLYPHLWENEEVRHKGALLRLALNPLRWPAIGVYLYVKVTTRWRVRQRFRRGEIYKWERDDSSREDPATVVNS
jgi:glycosyltransferase involved in cell wall biosynthesis